MRRECGNKWGKSWYNPKAGYPMFRYVEGGSPWGPLQIFLLGVFLLLLYFL